VIFIIEPGFLLRNRKPRRRYCRHKSIKVRNVDDPAENETRAEVIPDKNSPIRSNSVINAKENSRIELNYNDANE